MDTDEDTEKNDAITDSSGRALTANPGDMWDADEFPDSLDTTEVAARAVSLCPFMCIVVVCCVCLAY